MEDAIKNFLVIKTNYYGNKSYININAALEGVVKCFIKIWA